MRLNGKIALVTGAGSGIGAETARRMAGEGAIVACGDIRGAAAGATAAAIVAAGGTAQGMTLDVTNNDSIAATVARIVAGHGRLDILVNNAGVTIVGGVAELTEAEWDRQLEVNLKSVFRCSKAVWAQMQAQGGGVILNTASIAGLTAIPADAAYCTSKAGVVMLTKCMAIDGARDKIRVNCVCPGYIETPMIQGYFNDQPNPEAARQHAANMHPLGRLGRPDDIAEAFVYLASDHASWVTGSALVVDGGLISGLPPG